MSCRTLLVLVIASVFFVAGARAATPEGVPPELWSQIAPQVELAAYDFQVKADGAIARNRAQDFRIAADRAGLDVNGVLRLKASALNGAPLPDAPPVISEGRLEYRRGPVTEWFENRAEGLEQGFTVHSTPNNQRPTPNVQSRPTLTPASARSPDEVSRGLLATQERVTLEVLFETELAVQVADDGQSVVLTDDHGEVHYRYAKLHVTDAAGLQLASSFDSQISNLEPQILRIVCDVSQAQFPITIDPVLTGMAKKLLAPDGAAGDALGLAVAVDGDVAVVGAPSDDDAGTGSGAAYVFMRNAGGTNTWRMVKKLVAADGAAWDDFGLSVAVAGDVIVVGAHWDDDKGTDSGSAYVFERNLGGTNAWGLVKKLTASDGLADDEFGIAVAVAGDVAVVGSSGKSHDMGAAYVFQRNAGGTNAWGQVRKVMAADGGADDYFGHAVAVAGDVVVAGAYGKNTRAGAAYVFERNIGGTNNWGQVRKIVPSDALAECRFGYSVAVCGDVIVSGAYGDAGAGADSGAAYVYERNAGGTNAWGQVQKLIASDRVAGDQFGFSVAAAGDVVVVGANQDDDLGNNSGSAYVFERNAGGTNRWGQVQKITHPNGAMNDGFGKAVAAGGGLILVGVSGDDDLGVNSGSAFVFPAQREDWTETRKLLASDGAAYDYFGISVAVAGDVAIVGAYNDDDLGDDSGSAYVFERNAGGTNRWGQVKKLLAADGAVADEFGGAVAVAGDVAIVGADLDDDLGTSSGSAYVFERNAGGTNHWGQVKKLLATDGAEHDSFGVSVAVAGDVAIVGAYNDDDLGNDSGSAYIFERNAGGTNKWGQVRKLLAADGAGEDYFGHSVSVAGDVVIVGGYADDDQGDASGSAYIFERNAGGTNNWGQVKKLLATDGAEHDSFGVSVAVAGDVAIVGAWHADALATDSGAAYVFERNAGGTNNWGQVRKLLAADGAEYHYFGYAVAVAGDVVIVGACGDSDRDHTGWAYVFERNAGGTNNWGQVKKLTAADGAAGDDFGISVAMAGDVAIVGAYGDDSSRGAAYIFEGALFGPPTITNLAQVGGSKVLSFPAQMAWQYDVQRCTDLINGTWQNVAGLLNLPGTLGGSLTVEHATAGRTNFYRLKRHAP